MLPKEPHITLVCSFTDQFGRPQGVTSHLCQNHAMWGTLYTCINPTQIKYYPTLALALTEMSTVHMHVHKVCRTIPLAEEQSACSSSDTVRSPASENHVIHHMTILRLAIHVHTSSLQTFTIPLAIFVRACLATGQTHTHTDTHQSLPHK